MTAHNTRRSRTEGLSETQANPFTMTLRFRFANRLVDVSHWIGHLALRVAAPRDRDYFRRELTGAGSS